MNKLQKMIGASLSPLVLVGCEPQLPEFQEGKVTKESGVVTEVIKSSGGLFSKESVRIKPTYVLNVETRQGDYIISVRESYSKPLVALAEAIEIGDRIRFPLTSGSKGVFSERNYKYFSKDRIGSVSSNDISLPDR
mgnify:CR=1 FL=1